MIAQANGSFIGKLVLQVDWFGRKTSLAGKVVWQENWFDRETSIEGKSVLLGDSFTDKLV